MNHKLEVDKEEVTHDKSEGVKWKRSTCSSLIIAAKVLSSKAFKSQMQLIGQQIRLWLYYGSFQVWIWV